MVYTVLYSSSRW